jgi:Lon protease-like protein
MPRLLPLFPLPLVAFPGTVVPLHIFEERYKTMVGDCERNGSEFGIVLAKDGGIVSAGCTVIVESVLQRYPDGRFDVLTRGLRRFSVLSLDEELDWLRGEVDYFEDEDFAEVDGQLRARALVCWDQIRTALAETGHESHEPDPDPEHPQLSFQLGHLVSDVDFQSNLLRSRSESERLRQFIEFSREYVPRAHYMAKMKRVAPTNGSGHKPANL